jgi:hypothetical protein
LLGPNTIPAVVCPARTTNIFQALDLTFFGTLRKLKPIAIYEFEDGFIDQQIPNRLKHTSKLPRG